MTEFRIEVMITGDNIGIVNKRARMKKKNNQLYILHGVANKYSVLNMPFSFFMIVHMIEAVHISKNFLSILPFYP